MTLDPLLHDLLIAAIPTLAIAVIGAAYRGPFDRLKDSIEQVKASVAALAGKVDKLDEKVDGHNGRMVALETWANGARPQLDALDKAIAQLSAEIAGIKARKR